MTRRVHLNLGGLGVGYNVPLINRWLASSGTRLRLNTAVEISDPNIYTGGYVDPDTLELVSPCPTNVTHLRRYIALNLGYESFTQSNNLGGRQFKVKWDGKATGAINLNGADTGTWDNVAGEGTFTFQATPGNTELSLALTDWNDPPRNVRVWEVGHDAEFQAGEIFNPDWIAEIRGFHTLRSMDWQGTNNSEVSEWAHVANENSCRWARTFDKDITPQARGSFPLFGLAALANKTGANLHVCIPHRASDDLVEQMATYMKANVTGDSVVNYEYSNEVWNSQFAQFGYVRDWGVASGITNNGSVSWYPYGYLSAKFMNIIRNVYGPEQRWRWRGTLGTQTVSTTATTNIMLGVNRFRSDILANAIPVDGLFDELAITGYYGVVPTGKTISAITKANPGVVTTTSSHGYSNGQEIYIDISSNSGMTELNARYFTVANATSTTFELSGENTTGYTTFVQGSRRHTQTNSWPRLYDASVQRNIDEPLVYTDKYQYAAEIVRNALIGPSPKSFLHADGITSNSISVGVTLLDQRSTHWPGQKAISDANGLDLTQYEGGTHVVGDTALNSNGGEAKLSELVIVLAYREEWAELSEWMHREWFRLGGLKPSKFNCSGVPSQFGSWPGMRFYPGDTNPLWANIKDWNSGATPKTFRINLS